jgi:uracil-DNA glycosylase
MRAEHMKIMFEGLTMRSKELLAKKLSSVLSAAVVGVNSDLVTANPTDPLSVMTPPPELIFDAFRKCPVETVRVVIIGQDPYIKKGEAHGLSFSVPNGVAVPPSLRNIYKCLRWNKLLENIPNTGDLTMWAQQGVLLLNCALTTRIGKSNAHAAHWCKYTDALIKSLSDLMSPVIFVLFGGFAQEKKSLIDVRRHLIFEWGHPSNLNRDNGKDDNPKNFKYCNVFTRVNEHLKLHGGLPINWDPASNGVALTPLGPREMSAPTVGTAVGPSVERQTSSMMVALDRSDYCDVNELLRNEGFTVEPVSSINTSCANTNTVNASIIREWTDQDPQCYTSDVLWVFTDGGSKGNGSAKCVASYGWYVTDGEKVAADTGIVPAVDLAGSVYRASNNRGELTAILSAIEFVRDHGSEFSFSSITIVSDSEYSIKSITDWIYKWEKDPAKAADKKNLDLISAAKNIVEKLKLNVKVVFRHVRSHQPEPADSDCEEWFVWKCNEIVDLLCNKSLGR